MGLNHLKTTPLPPCPWKTLSSAKPVPGANKAGDHCLRNKETLFVAFKNDEKDRELKVFMDTNAFVSCCPQSHQKFFWILSLPPIQLKNNIQLKFKDHIGFTQ